MRFSTCILAAASVAALAGVAHAADLGTLEPVPMAPAAAYSWTGAYVGLQGGYSWGEASQTYDDPGSLPPVTINPMNPQGWGGGLEAGANYQFASGLVLGVEADVTFANITDTIDDNLGNFSGPTGETVTTVTDLAGNVRGRIGYAFDRTLIFGAGGLAVAHNTVTATDGDLSEDATLIGWTIGGGIEQAVTNRISVKAEYLYTHHGDHTWFADEVYANTGDDSASTVRVGLNLHF